MKLEHIYRDFEKFQTSIECISPSINFNPIFEDK